MANREGRPTVMTPEVIAKLEEGFIMGFSDREASLYADISPSSLYDYCKEYPEFSDRKELLKESVKLRAKKNIVGGINGGDKPLSQWYLERKDKSFSTKQEVEHSGAVVINLQHYGINDPLPVEPGSTPTPDTTESKPIQSDSVAPEGPQNDSSDK